MAYPTEQPAGPSQPHEGPEPGVPGEGAAAPALHESEPGAIAPVSGWRRWTRMQGPPRPWRRSLAAGAGSAVAIIVLGVPLGLLWAWLAPTVPVINAGDSGMLVTDPSPEQYIAADGWFTLLGLGFGLVVAAGSWLVLRRHRGPHLLFGVVAGTFVAGRWVAPIVGEWLGRDAYDRWRETAVQGATYLAPPELQSLGPKLVPAFIAAIVLTLLAGWSNDPDLDHPGAQPGYGPNHGYPPYAAAPAGPSPEEEQPATGSGPRHGEAGS